MIDSKQYRGRLKLDPSGRLWHGRYPLAPTLRAVSFEADRAAQVLTDPDVVVVPIVAVHGAQVPWGKVGVAIHLAAGGEGRFLGNLPPQRSLDDEHLLALVELAGVGSALRHGRRRSRLTF